MSDWLPLFYFKQNDCIVFSDDINALKSSLESSYKLVVPGKDEIRSSSSFLDFRFNLSSSVPLLAESASGAFKTGFNDWLPLLKNIQVISVTDNGESGNPSIVFNIKWKIPMSMNANWEEKAKTFLDTNLTSGLVRLESKKSDQYFWVVQDSKSQTYLLDDALQTRFKIPLSSRWVSSPQIIENEKKTGFSVFFPSHGALYLVSQKGKMQQPFPIYLPDSVKSIEHSAAIDYDNSFQYRLFTSGRYGSVFAADLNGLFLENWNPWKHNVPLSLAPQHVRIGEKDVILILDQNGSLVLTNRKGEVQTGFPVQLNSRTNQPFFIENGLDFKTSFVYILSEFGRVEKIDFLGNAISSQQLFRPDKDTKFQFCIDQRKKTFVVARISSKNVVLFDQSYRQVFEFASQSSNILVQHFHFGAGNKIFAIIDVALKKCSLFDEAGQALMHPVIETEHKIDILKKKEGESGYKLILSHLNRLSILEFEKD